MKIYSARWSVAKGAHWVFERECAPGFEQPWLEVFQRDEPTVEFKVSTKMPRKAPKVEATKVGLA